MCSCLKGFFIGAALLCSRGYSADPLSSGIPAPLAYRLCSGAHGSSLPDQPLHRGLTAQGASAASSGPQGFSPRGVSLDVSIAYYLTFLHDDLYYQQGGSISSSSIADTPAEENEDTVMSDEAARIMSSKR